MLKKLKGKRIIAFFLLMITLLSTTQPIFAASGTGKWVGGQFASYIKTTDNANTKYGSYYTPVNSNIRKACKIAYLGWYKEHGDYIINGGTSGVLSAYLDLDRTTNGKRVKIFINF